MPSPRLQNGNMQDNLNDEKSMQGLIRSTMMTMLQPVAEHVREIQEQTSQLVKGLATNNARIDENKLHLDQQQQDLQAFRTCLAHTDSHVDRLQTDLIQTRREKERLFTEHEVTKGDLTKVAANLRESTTVLKALQVKTEDMEADIRKLHGAATKAATKLQDNEEKSAQLREFAESLSGQHADLVREVVKVAQAGSTTDSALRKFIHSCEQSDAGLQNELARLDDHLNSLEGRLGKTQGQLLEVSDSYKVLDAAWKQLKGSFDIDTGTRHADTFQTWRDHAASALSEAISNVDRIDKSLAQLSTTVISDKESADAQFRDLESRLKVNASKVDSLGNSLQGQGEQIRKHEVHVSRMQKGLEALGEQADLLHADQKGLREAHNEAANKQELQRIALAKTQADLSHANKEIHHASKQVFALQDGMAETSKDVTTLGSRYDSCTRNILGMSKGFQDISRHVHQGEHGLLQPRSARRLPELRSTSRHGSPERSSPLSNQTFEPRRFE
mmetsp:Transcript_133910/g.267243  ORF Transcript_133910/g.267243 Transcript_133910/m.267243 type:complete len:502 (+) Transcript_133910:98-1603(+)